MKRLCTILLASLVLLALSTPAWANGSSLCKVPSKKKDYTHHRHNHHKHEKKVLKQFRELKKTYNRSLEDARQMFLEFLGATSPATDEEIQKIRDEYEQQIAQLNEAVSSYQEQLAALEASKNQELAALEASHQAALAECVLQNDATYQDGYTAGAATCENTDPGNGSTSEPQLVNSLSMPYFYPYAVDVADGSGNFFVLDADNRSVVEFNSNGAQSSQWPLSNSTWPVDLAVDSNGAVFVLDRLSADSLQKYAPDGSPVSYIPTASLVSPLGLFVDSQDTIYVADMGGTDGGGRVQAFDSSGAWQRTFSEDPALQGEAYYDIAVDEQNQVAYAVTGSMVAKFDLASGDFLGSWPGAFTGGNSIAVGSQGQVFVSDMNTNLIYQYDTNGNLIYTIGSNDGLQAPAHIVVDSAGALYVCDYLNLAIKIYQ